MGDCSSSLTAGCLKDECSLLHRYTADTSERRAADISSIDPAEKNSCSDPKHKFSEHSQCFLCLNVTEPEHQRGRETQPVNVKIQLYLTFILPIGSRRTSCFGTLLRT